MKEVESVEVIHSDGKDYDYRAITRKEWEAIVARVNLYETYHHDRSTALGHLEHQIKRNERWSSRWMYLCWFVIILQNVMIIVVTIGFHMSPRWSSRTPATPPLPSVEVLSSDPGHRTHPSPAP
jgi:hypothetical protein